MNLIIRLSLALSLLTTELIPSRGEFAYCKAELQFIGQCCEILDARELRYVFVKPDEIKQDLAMIRQRATSLRYAPFAHEVLLFTTPRTAANELIMMNFDAMHQFQRVLNVYPHNEKVSQALEECKLLYAAWDCLRDAQCDYYYVHIRRQALGKLRDLIGQEAFDRGIMPPHVPWWRMGVVR